MASLFTEPGAPELVSLIVSLLLALFPAPLHSDTLSRVSEEPRGNSERPRRRYRRCWHSRAFKTPSSPLPLIATDVLMIFRLLPVSARLPSLGKERIRPRTARCVQKSFPPTEDGAPSEFPFEC